MVHIYLTNGDRLTVEPSSWSLHPCGAVEIMTGPDYMPHTILAPGTWVSMKFEYAAPTTVPEVRMK